MNRSEQQPTSKPQGATPEESYESEILDSEVDEAFRERYNEGNIPMDISHIPIADSVNLYFRQMAAEPLLTASEEVELAKRIEKGKKATEQLIGASKTLKADKKKDLVAVIKDSQAAREHLSRANTRLVVSIAKKYKNQGLPMSDLIQEGNMGLMRAVDKFDYHRGNRFGTYATWWIRQGLTRALSQKSRIIRPPLHVVDELRRIKKTYQVMNQEFGREPTDQELADRLGMDPDIVKARLDAQVDTFSLDSSVGGGTSVLGDLIEDDETPDPDEYAELLDDKVLVGKALGNLLEREALVLKLRFGLDTGSERTLEEVGKMLNLSRERIRQIEKIALRKLRNPKSSAGYFLRDRK